jgi:stage IV sporulation protein A
MDKFDLYRDIALRTGGDIYVGVVGPVRTGKSTFIKTFMEGLVIDNIADKNKRVRTIDELPQSADGRTIMTTQPKFVPNEAVKVAFSDELSVNMRMIDCVGYLVEGALGHKQDGKERLVRTPWSAEDMPFERAAELGTEKVIREHSTIGVLVTTDGTICELDRSKYIAAEERVVSELKEYGKPFVVVLNSAKPDGEDAQKLRDALAEKYQVPVVAKNVVTMKEADIAEIMESILLEFPIRIIDAIAPRWVQALSIENSIIVELLAKMRQAGDEVLKMKDYSKLDEIFRDCRYMNLPASINLDAGKGRVEITLSIKENLFFNVASEECGVKLENDFELLCYLKQLSCGHNKTAKLMDALKQAEDTGYGVVFPAPDEMVLEEPELVKQGGQYGVKLRASAPSLHIVKVDVETEVSPIVGSEQQSEELVRNLLADFGDNKAGIWQTNIFGKSLSSLVNDGLNNKLCGMPKDAQQKLRRTLQRIINEGRGGVICILL